LWQRSILALFIIAAAGSALALRKQPLLSVGWSRALLGASFRLAITLVFLTIFLRGKIFAILNGVSPDQGMALVLLVVIALAEETVFRGYIQLRLSSWLGEMAGWLTTALLYTIWQIPLLMLIDSTLPLPQRLALVAAQAVVLGWLMRRTGHVLAPAMYRAVSGWISLL
jgi:membrane protease YdiL (CAAX protease family)